MAAMCRSCFFQLRQLRTIRSSLTTDAAKTLAQAFVGGRLDYCNSLLYGVSGELLQRLQSVQNAGMLGLEAWPRPRGRKTWPRPRPRPRGLWPRPRPRPRGFRPRPRGFWPRASRPLEAYNRNGTECDWK